MSELTASIVMNLTGNFELQARRNGRALGSFSRDSNQQLSRVRRSAQSVGQALDSMGNRYTGMLAGVAATYGATQAIIESGKLDKRLIQIQQTAGATAEQVDTLRAHLHTMSQETGQSMDALLSGFDSLVQSGQGWEQALITIGAINPAMVVTGAQADVLAAALGVAAEAFEFDLSQPKLAVSLIDQMTVAGRKGNAELEDLSGVFARIGVNAKTAGLSFSDTLGFVERLSLIERNPERLSTLADSTLRLFTNNNYMQNAAKATGVKFYDAEGERRSAFDVIDDIAEQYRQLENDQQRAGFISGAFGKADLDTIKGLRTLLSGDAVSEMRGMSREIAAGTGTISKDLDNALANSIDQVERLKNALRSAADEFAQPINDVIEKAIKHLLDERGLTGKEMLVGGAGAAALGFGLMKGGGKLLQRFGGVGAGLAAGKALEEVAGVTPVYVVNMPGSGMSGTPGRGRPPGGPPGGGPAGRRRRIFNPMRNLGRAPIGAISTLGAGAVGTAALAVGAAGAAGYGVGTLINKYALESTEIGREIGNGIGESIAQALAFFGNDEAQAAIDANAKAKNAGTLSIKVDQEGRIRSVTPQRGPDGPEINVDLGITGLIP